MSVSTGTPLTVNAVPPAKASRARGARSPNVCCQPSVTLGVGTTSPSRTGAVARTPRLV